MSPFNLFTIGYAGFLIKDFITTLKQESIGALVDIRSFPYSSRFSDYDIKNIKYSLNENNIFYLFLGNELGARPKDTSLYTNKIADFNKMAKSEPFIEACSRIREGLNKFPICLMCAEKEPLACHRTILVANSFRKLYPKIRILHIHSLSKIETQEKLDRRIMAMYHLEQEDFFKSFDERLEEAYLLREKAIAYNNAI